MHYSNESVPRISVVQLPQNIKKIDQKKKQTVNTLTLLKSSLLYQIKEFFNKNTLHAVHYIAESGRPFVEKFVWFCYTAIGSVAALVIIFSLWEKFQTDPTITGLDTDFHNQQVAFPQVLVCPEVPFNAAKVQTTAANLSNSGDDGEQFVLFLEQLTKMSYPSMQDIHDTSTKLDWAALRKPLRSYVFDVAIECRDLFTKCTFKDEEIDCCKSFLPIFFEQGFCYAFNSRFIDHATLEEKNEELFYVHDTDTNWALEIEIEQESWIYINAQDESPGYDFNSQFLWQKNYVADILILMKQTFTTEDARQLSITQRKCIFPDERKLKYSDNEYTFTHCMKDCRIDKVLRFCKCIPAFYKLSESYKECIISDYSCVAQYSENITVFRDCRHCELSCYNTVYDIEKLSSVPITTDKNESDVTIKFLTWPTVRYKREVLFGWVDLLVSFGGIAGLFLGFSLLSAVEIIYYFTMRACCMVYKNHNKLVEIVKENDIIKPLPQYDLSLMPNYPNRKKIKPTNRRKIRGRVSWAEEKSKFVRPNFKIGSIKTFDIYEKTHFDTQPTKGGFSYMP